jgi:putative Mg2+ transporter-C (MgtC) family protein
VPIAMTLSPFFHHLWTTVVPLLMAGLCGGIVGVERESANRPAGLRTHVLVCIGSALVMQVSISMYAMVEQTGVGNADPGRIAAQVVSGIGFLGAGTIMREGATIRGLTTAASLWVVAGVGLAVGSGLYLESIVATTLVVVTLKSLSYVERRFLPRAHRTLILNVTDTPGRLGALATVCGRWGANIRSVNMRQGPVAGTVEITFSVKLSGRSPDTTGLIGELMATEGVISVSEEE